MNKMNKDQAIERICCRLHGDMSAAEASQFDLELQSNSKLAHAYQQMSKMERALGDFPVLKPSANFTTAILRKIQPRAVTVNVKEKATWQDWLTGLAPALGVGVFALIWGRELWTRVVMEISESAGWVDQTLGTRWFESQPFALLAVLIPVVVLGVGYMALHDYWEAEA